MFTKKEIKQNLLGCFEIFLFMRNGVERFEASKTLAIKSFIVPLVLLPFSLLAVLAVQSTTPINTLIAIRMSHLVITAILFLGFVYYFMKQYSRDKHMWRFITVSNWMTIPLTIFLIPLLIGRFMGVELATFESYLIFTTLIGYVYSAYTLTLSFKLPWELGGFMAIVGLAINEHVFKLGVIIHDNLISIS